MSLAKIYSDKKTYNELIEFYSEVLNELVLIDAYAGNDTSYAKKMETVQNMMTRKLEAKFGAKKKPTSQTVLPKGK